MLSVNDLLWYVDEALDDLVAILTGLGDDRANRVPDLDGANCAYAIVTHCLGVMEYWGGHIVAGRPDERDRPGEFRARGAVADLVVRVRQARDQLAVDLAAMAPFDRPRGNVEAGDAVLPLGRTQGGAAMHIFEELAQHRGQLEITRDLLMAPSRPTVG